MLKWLSAAFFLLLLLSFACADMFMVSPEVKRISDASVIEAGSAQRGETVELIFSEKTGYEGKHWSALSVKVAPEGWNIRAAKEGKALIASVEVPADAKPNIYNITLVFSNPAERLVRESLDARLSVEENLLKASITNLNRASLVNEAVEYKVVLNNESIAEHTVLIGSTLSTQWFEPVEIRVGAKKTLEETLTVIPRGYGKKRFRFSVLSAMNGSSFGSFESVLDVMPTLNGKYSCALYGFPFFTVSLLPYYLVDSAVSYLIP